LPLSAGLAALGRRRRAFAWKDRRNRPYIQAGLAKKPRANSGPAKTGLNLKGIGQPFNVVNEVGNGWQGRRNGGRPLARTPTKRFEAVCFAVTLDPVQMPPPALPPMSAPCFPGAGFQKPRTAGHGRSESVIDLDLRGYHRLLRFFFSLIAKFMSGCFRFIKNQHNR
jgi:hypothetical protein